MNLISKLSTVFDNLIVSELNFLPNFSSVEFYEHELDKATKIAEHFSFLISILREKPIGHLTVKGKISNSDFVLSTSEDQSKEITSYTILVDLPTIATYCKQTCITRFIESFDNSSTFSKLEVLKLAVLQHIEECQSSILYFNKDV